MFANNNCVVTMEFPRPLMWSAKACPTFDGLIRVWELCVLTSHWECPFGCPFDGALRYKVMTFTDEGMRSPEVPAGTFCLPTLPPQ